MLYRIGTFFFIIIKFCTQTQLSGATTNVSKLDPFPETNVIQNKLCETLVIKPPVCCEWDLWGLEILLLNIKRRGGTGC